MNMCFPSRQVKSGVRLLLRVRHLVKIIREVDPVI